ncbi:hypothetical protein LWE61_09490 [Sphingobium sufflavum]|uniref:hypothetical protein n=1 Tax=Sphingobium sufflavum TaxID=1129547 RepID=UPI001F39666C|nr:hypothetical protein [Sphingobium sufflavum]MCE7796789.1 hypothetical protein [Sphingobium sufflavum]
MVRAGLYTALLGLFSLAMATPAPAGWKLLAAKQPVQVGTMVVTPTADWNQAGARPGKQGVAWTQDGFGLNGLEFFAAVPSGLPLYRERSAKQNPMPRFDSTMLLPDLTDFFERSFRVQNNLTDFAVESSEPASFGGHAGVVVRYRYSLPNDELKRRGVARLAVVGKQLFVGNFYGPELHYFPTGLPQAEAIMESARF